MALHHSSHRIPRLALFTVVILALLYVGLSTGLRTNPLPSLPADLTIAGAQDILNQVVQQGYSTKPTVNELVSILQFEQVFQSMTTGELLRALVAASMVPGYNSATQLIADLPSHGIDLDTLQPKPYGLLTALATAKGGPLLGSGPLTGVDKTQLAFATRNALENLFQTNRIQFLNNFTSRNLLKLFDADRITTAQTDSHENMFVYSWAAPNGSTTNNIIPASTLYVNYLSTDIPVYRDPVSVRDAVNTIVASLPSGAPHVLLNINYNERINEVWDAGLGKYRCSTNPCQVLPRFAQTAVAGKIINLPWMDAWRNAVRAKMDDFMRQYRDAGGLLDVFMYDSEDYNTQLDQLFSQQGVQPDQIWAAIRIDSRWPALATQLVQAGLTADDVSATATPWTWMGAKDYRAAIWNKVMQENRTRYHIQAMYEPVKQYFPNVLFANYRDAFQTHAFPANNYIRMNTSWAGLGSIIGNVQGPSPYSDGDASTPTGLSASLYQQRGQINVDSFEVANNKLTLYCSENVRLPRSGGNIVLSAGYRSDANNNPFDPTPYVGTSGSRTYTVSSHPDLRTYIINVIAPNTSRVSKSGYPLLTITVGNPYGQFVSWLRKVYSPLLASYVPVRTYLPAPEWMATELVPTPPYFAELIFHDTLLGAQIEFWNTTGAGITPNGNKFMGDAFKEVTDLIGFRNRKTLFSMGPEWTDNYVISGMEAGGQKIWRLTPNGLLYDAPSTILRSSNPVQILFNSTSPTTVPSYTFTMDNAELITGSSVSSQGFWIRQTQGRSYLTVPWTQVASALGL